MDLLVPKKIKLLNKKMLGCSKASVRKAGDTFNKFITGVSQGGLDECSGWLSLQLEWLRRILKVEVHILNLIFNAFKLNKSFFSLDLLLFHSYGTTL